MKIYKKKLILFVKKKDVKESNVGIGIYTKKLDLFDTKENQEQKGSFVINIFGKFKDVLQFEKMNSKILDLDIEATI